MSDGTLGASAPTRTYEATASTTTCTKNVNAPCRNEATEILYAAIPGGQLEVFPRCAEHPAAEDVAMISRVYPFAETKIVPADTLPGLSLLAEVISAAIEVLKEEADG
jgi:hypothetical protein